MDVRLFLDLLAFSLGLARFGFFGWVFVYILDR